MSKNNQKLREQHSLMEGQRSSSYAIFADAPEYWFSYDAYLDLFRQYAQKKDSVNILNIGAATGILEYLALKDIPNLHFVSVDNSRDFTDRFQKKNKEAIEAGKVEHVFSSIQEFETEQRFDIIVSRDINHHIEKDVVEQYIKHCYGMLNEGGAFIIEDLKREAEEVGINDLVKVVYSIPAFKTDDYNRYHKIMGIIDSYFVAYHTEEMEELLKRIKLPYTLENEKYRYKFVVKKNNMIEERETKDVKVSKNVRDLFDMACDIALQTKNDELVTKKASGRLRFFWCKPYGKKNTEKQEQLRKWIDECIKETRKVHFQILLFTNLENIQNSEEKTQENQAFLDCVKVLLEAGADIRYSNEDDRFRISLHGNTVHLAISENIEEPVVRGMNYYGKTDNDGLVKYFNRKFDLAFKKAQPIELNNGRIQIKQS